ncbi:MAG: flagellin FliC [Nitrospira sp.]|nr:flagellin FliC [Nitrospira sp.]MCB9711342.1 flagellin FliC [Nitrospiraceae bacterium]MDR4486340.1 flagellin FliC [Nitrospirales bacterium]MCA9464494.1 flagellin FliC [Nitrospira sp.]MCA9474345.1 flagellin FliC [Nitrospira sp.]
MALIVNNNIASINAQRNLGVSTSQLEGSVARLSSGLRITRAADDAAGLGISETLRAQIRSINQAVRNANDGISLLQIADGGAEGIGNLLARMRELAEQSASGILGSNERSFLDQEFVALRSEIDRISAVTEFNNVKLLSGTGNDSLSIQIGFRSSSNDTLTLSLNDLNTNQLTLSSVNVSTSANAVSALSNIDSAISSVASARANIGSLQNRLDAAVQNLQVAGENVTAAESRIRDADIAFETAKFVRNQILVSAGTSILAQANTLPQQALSLLQ